MRHSQKKLLLGLLAGVLFGSPVGAKDVDVLSCDRYDIDVIENSAAGAVDRKVILLEFDDGGFPDATAARASDALRNAVEELLGKAGTEVKDASLIENQAIREEIQRYELDGSSEFSTALATDAISAKLTNIAVSSEYNEATSYTNKKGETIRSPAYCRYSTSIEGVLKIYSVNPLRLTQTADFKDSEGFNVDGDSQSCQITDETRARLVRTAIDEAIVVRGSAKVYEAFPAVGYVREVRKCSKSKVYVWISTLPSNGATPKAAAEFFERETYTDPYSKEVIMREKLVGSGSIVTTTNSNEAWVKLKKYKDVDKLRIGHLVKIEQKTKKCLPGTDICM